MCTGPQAIEVPAGEVELGWFVLPCAWGRGFATEAAGCLRDEAFERLHLERVIARTQPLNVASNRVAQRIGMRLERQTTGRHGEDACVYELQRDAWVLARGRDEQPPG